MTGSTIDPEPIRWASSTAWEASRGSEEPTVPPNMPDHQTMEERIAQATPPWPSDSCIPHARPVQPNLHTDLQQQKQLVRCSRATRTSQTPSCVNPDPPTGLRSSRNVSPPYHTTGHQYISKQRIIHARASTRTRDDANGREKPPYPTRREASRKRMETERMTEEKHRGRVRRGGN